MRPAEAVLIGQNVPIGAAQVAVGLAFGNLPVVAIGAANAIASLSGLVIVSLIERNKA